MKTSVTKFLKTMTIWPAVVLFAIFTWGIPTGFCATPGTAPDTRYQEGGLAVEKLKILSVLEDRMGDEKILEKTKDKLLTLNDKKVRLISSLCERISDGERTAGADIAFSLVTALIVLS
jgi:4-hydroxybenzoate polyprenyltransferase